ncbi:hypothetical protein OK016_00845 [Vibrio chagasii]|nr:hypothetical protein [Vibrio chagasii]
MLKPEGTIGKVMGQVTDLGHGTTIPTSQLGTVVACHDGLHLLCSWHGTTI